MNGEGAIDSYRNLMLIGLGIAFISTLVFHIFTKEKEDQNLEVNQKIIKVNKRSALNIDQTIDVQLFSSILFRRLFVQQNIHVDYQSLVLNLLKYEDFLPLILPQCQQLVQ